MSCQFCLGGCNPLASYKLTSCRPAPVCRDAQVLPSRLRKSAIFLIHRCSIPFPTTLVSSPTSHSTTVMLVLTVSRRSSAFSVVSYHRLSRADWVVEKGNIMNTGSDLGMLLTRQNGGTRLSSTRYVHYGTITARRQSIFSDHLTHLIPHSTHISQSKRADGVASSRRSSP